MPYSTAQYRKYGDCVAEGCVNRAPISPVLCCMAPLVEAERGLGEGRAVDASTFLDLLRCPPYKSVQQLKHAADALCLAPFLQPFSPMQNALEGVLLGSMQLPYLFRRTIAAGLLGCAWQWGAARAGWGLPGVWLGILMLPAVYLLHDSLHLKSRESPFAGPSQKLALA